jgi:putative transposase
MYDPARHHRRSIRLKNYDYSHAGAYFVTLVTQDRKCLFGDVTGGKVYLNDAGNMIRDTWLSLPRMFHMVCMDEFVVMPDHFHGIITIGLGHLPVIPTMIGSPVGAPLVGALCENHMHTNLSFVMGATSTMVPKPTMVPTSTMVSTSTMGIPSTTMGIPSTMDTTFATGVDRASGEKGAPTRGAPTTITILGEIVGAFKSISTVKYIRGHGNAGWLPFNKRLWQRNYYERIIRDERSLNRIRRYILENPIHRSDDSENRANLP